ncbi:MAG: hypothetical protein KF713_18805 [Turneriella sp.]|nr:hypothetical protein [Turneriella sp.]
MKITALACMAFSPLGAEQYEAQVFGVSSWATQNLRNSLASAYGVDSPVYLFTDYGGKFFWRGGFIEPGITTGVFTSIGVRGDLRPSGSVPTIAGGNPVSVSGDFRFALAWVPLQLRGRIWLYHDIFFIEAGTGPAYGFGALEYRAQYSTGITDNRYQKYNEWGWLTSAALGADFELLAGLHLQLSVEGAWLVSRIRNPNILATSDVMLSQWFLRPGLAVALRF